MKPEVDEIEEQVSMLHQKATYMRRHKLVAEQNIKPMEDALEVVQDTLHALEEAAKQACWCPRSDSQVQDTLHAFVDVHGQIAWPL